MRQRLLLTLLMLLLTPLGWADKAANEKLTNVAVFTPRAAPISLEELKEMAPDATILKDDAKKGLLSYSLEWGGGTKLTMNIKADYDHETQGNGMLGWLSKFPKSETQTPQVNKLSAFVRTIKNSYGLILPQGFDKEGNLTKFILKLGSEADGALFSANSFFDSQGFLIIGPPGAPPFIGQAGSSLLTMKPKVAIEDLIQGKWQAKMQHTESEDEVDMTVAVTSVDEFQPGGRFGSVGSTKILMIPQGESKGSPLSFDFIDEGTWEVKNDQVIITTTEMKTSNHKASNAELKELLEELIKEIREDKTPEKSWVISRDPDFMLLQEAEEGYVGTWTRIK